MFKFTMDVEKLLYDQVYNIEKGLDQGMTKASERILNIARPLAPIDTGRLRASGRVEKPNKMTRHITFYAENPDSGYDYAPIQHEALHFNHPNGGQAKYLSEPFEQNTNEMIDIIGDTIHRRIRI